MEPAVVLAGRSNPAVCGSTALVALVWRFARDWLLVAPMAAIVGDLALTLAGVSFTWPPLSEVSAPASLAVALAGLLRFDEMPRLRERRAQATEWEAFERAFRAYADTTERA